jgi:hypothetical protein
LSLIAKMLSVVNKSPVDVAFVHVGDGDDTDNWGA